MRVLPPSPLARVPALLGVDHAVVLDASESAHRTVHWIGEVPAGEEARAAPYTLPVELPLPDDIFDGIILSGGPDAADGLRHVRPGGALFSSGPGGLTLLKRKASALPAAAPTPAPASPPHRAVGYALLHGHGLEIGAFNEPAPIATATRIQYFDAIDAPTARRLFPEIDPTRFVDVDYMGDLDRGGLDQFSEAAFDFVVCNHVIEHVANPARLVENLFRLVRPGGHIVLTVPDKRFTFDHERPLTPLAHLWADYDAGVTTNDDSHYREFLTHVTPHVLAESPDNQARHIELCRERREHAHVWDSGHFRAFVGSCLDRFAIKAEQLYESVGRDNRLEYFSVWRKLEGTLSA